MGEIAEMMLDGTLDCVTGEYIGADTGYPVTYEKGHPTSLYTEEERCEMYGPRGQGRRNKKDRNCPHCNKAVRGSRGLAMHVKAKHS